MIETIKLDYDLAVFLEADYEQHHGSCISYQIREQKWKDGLCQIGGG